MVTSKVYWDNVSREYGNTESTDDKSQRFKSDFKIEEMVIGFKLLNAKSNTISTVVDATANSVQVTNVCHKKNIDAFGKRKGINSTNWYQWDDINRTFKRTKQD